MTEDRPARLEVVEFDLGAGVAGYYYEDRHAEVAAVAVDPELPQAEKVACEVQARGHHSRRPPKGGRKFMLEAWDVDDLDANAISAIRCVIDDLGEAWVQEVKDACRIANHPRVIAAWCDLSVAVVVAILLNLEARGELPCN